MEMIRLATFGDFLRYNHGLGCWCPGCQRMASCDIAELVRNGLGDREVNRCRPRCRKCGSVGEWRVGAPVPQR